VAISVAGIVEFEGFSAGERLTLCNITLDSSYPTGGSAGLKAALNAVLAGGGMGTILGVVPMRSFGLVIEYIIASDLLKCYWTGAVVSTALAEVTNATNLSADVVPCLVIGTE